MSFIQHCTLLLYALHSLMCCTTAHLYFAYPIPSRQLGDTERPSPHILKREDDMAPVEIVLIVIRILPPIVLVLEPVDLDLLFV